MSAADIAIYNELRTVLVLHRRELSNRETPDLFTWYSRMSKLREIIEVD